MTIIAGTTIAMTVAGITTITRWDGNRHYDGRWDNHRWASPPRYVSPPRYWYAPAAPRLSLGKRPLALGQLLPPVWLRAALLASG